jgi:hypothetical protein
MLEKAQATGDLVNAGIAQLVEHDLAKVGVASSSLVSRSSSIHCHSLHSASAYPATANALRFSKRSGLQQQG